MPPGTPPPPANPKLDGALNQLIEADKRGESESFTRQRNIDFVNGMVRVAIYAAAGQLDAVANMTAKVGSIETISQDLNAVGALVPITSLTKLADEKSVSSIKLAVKPVPTNYKYNSKSTEDDLV